MKDTLAGRVGRIISGSVNALIDAMEQAAPETVMLEAIREIDGAVDEIRAELGQLIANRHLATQRLQVETGKHADLTHKIELAVEQGREDLAEAAIARQLDIEAQLPVLEAALSDYAGKEKELEGYINALKAKKREMKEELSQFRASRSLASDATGAAEGTPSAGGDVDAKVSKAQSAFERIMENSTGLGGTPSSSPSEAAKLAELDELARRNRIQERLAAIKNRNA